MLGIVAHSRVVFAKVFQLISNCFQWVAADSHGCPWISIDFHLLSPVFSIDFYLFPRDLKIFQPKSISASVVILAIGA